MRRSPEFSPRLPLSPLPCCPVPRLSPVMLPRLTSPRATLASRSVGHRFGGDWRRLGQGRAAASALDGIARNPQASGKIFTPMIVALALIESLVIYGLLIAFNLAGKI